MRGCRGGGGGYSWRTGSCGTGACIGWVALGSHAGAGGGAGGLRPRRKSGMRALCPLRRLQQHAEHVLDETLERGRQQGVGTDEVAQVDDVCPPFVDTVRELGAAALDERCEVVEVPAPGGRRDLGPLDLGDRFWLGLWVGDERDRLGCRRRRRLDGNR